MNNERICMGRPADASNRTTGLIKGWVGLIGGILLCASTQVFAQICEAERQAWASIVDPKSYKYNENWNIPKLMEHIQIELMDGGEFRFMSIYPEFQTKGVFQAGHPRYREALLAFADAQDARVKANRERGPGDIAFYRHRGCVARNMATQIKSKRPYQQ